ncbi:DUF3806 domain-containing protein [Ornithinimicrobium sediminis]|uniref:DUF3806 domain-containing protein n=1 Tax=Ornithinimicrobium sediminis TaxID=2904603 RepID=UPI001E60A4F6|nr:DUF3806 domain-containing protein [Ornithinimicrobium sediminis]MCE0486854.1 DUF3806 domain-containing protein [Ornithinimicrobium sediminis]
MGWFSRKKGPESPPVSSGPSLELPSEEDVSDEGGVLEPGATRIGPDEEARIARAVRELEAEGVDLDDLTSIGAGYDAAFQAWVAGNRKGDHAAVVERYAMGVGEHLDRHTDLDWKIVTDVFGTDLAVAGGFRHDFVVVPTNLVGGRWMRGDTGWVPEVVGHIVRRRER